MTNREAIIKLLGLLKCHRKAILIIVGCLLVTTVINLCIPLFGRDIMDKGFLGGNKKLLIQLVLLSMAAYGLNALISMIKEKKRVDIAAEIQYFLSEQSFKHIMKIKISYFNHTNYAELLNNINTDVNKMASIADDSTFFVVTQTFGMAGGLIGLLIIDFRMTLFVLAFIPIKFFIMKYLARKQRTMVNEYIRKHQNYARWFGDTVAGAREVRLFNISVEKHQEFTDNQNRIIEKQKQINMLSQWNMLTNAVMLNLLTTILYIIGSNLVFDLHLSVGSVFAFITYSSYVTEPITAILNIGYFLSGIIPSTKRYHDFMNLEEEADGQEHPEFGDIRFQNVAFAYEGDKFVLEDINMMISKGSKVAFIGKNGAGKSTIVELLLRMYEVSKGQILFAGKNIAGMSLADYRSMISVVSQEIYLFNDTIRNNICLYKQADDEMLFEICSECGLREYISEVSLDYLVGQNGVMLSGGQKQKIALARALLHNRPIIIFDEATSSADIYSEQQINSLLHTRLADKTVILITHRTEVLSDVDQIIELDNGRIA